MWVACFLQRASLVVWNISNHFITIKPVGFLKIRSANVCGEANNKTVSENSYMNIVYN